MLGGLVPLNVAFQLFYFEICLCQLAPEGIHLVVHGVSDVEPVDVAALLAAEAPVLGALVAVFYWCSCLAQQILAVLIGELRTAHTSLLQLPYPALPLP